MESVLIFENHQIEKLKQNIVELQRQKSMQMKEYKEVRLMQVCLGLPSFALLQHQHFRMQNRLNREKKEREEENADLLKKCTELQLLKFGRIVDVEAMQESRINQAAEELKV